MMKAIGSRELKNRLGAYLRDVREGWTIVVTDRGRPIAELRPIAAAATDEEARLQELGTLGLVSPRKSTTLPERKRVRIAGKPLSETIAEDRQDRV
jgi:prevent-host-death family protein